MPVRDSVLALADKVRAEYGDAALGVLFYGSCLRKKTDEGVLDFWVVVESYPEAYAQVRQTRPLRAAALGYINRFAAPNVFYREHEIGGETLRTKYGVIDLADFTHGTSLRARHPYIWARFAQPARLLHARDEAAREAIVNAIAEAIPTMVGRLLCFLPSTAGLIRFRMAAFWQEAFRRTYDSERRPEADDSIRSLYRVDEERYDAAAALALRLLAERGRYSAVTLHPQSAEVRLESVRQRGQRLRWRLARPYARSLGLVRLFKTAWTFGDWVPYALWKLERHTGRRIELSPRQRKHPLIFGWPIILPLLMKRNLR